MGQGDSRSPRPLLEHPLVEKHTTGGRKKRGRRGAGAFGWCMVIINLCWGAIIVSLYTKLSQKQHTHNSDAAIIWILNQLGEGDVLNEHPPSDPWWETRPLGALDLPFAPSGPISPALQWVLLKLGQEEALEHHNVSSPWWLYRPQTNITLNATNVTVAPIESRFVEKEERRRLNAENPNDPANTDDEPVRLFVNGRVRVAEYVEYYSPSSTSSDKYIKLIMAPESLRYVLKVFGLTERPWWDDRYWVVRDNITEINVTKTFNMMHMTADSIVADDLIVEGPMNTFGSVDFWPSQESYQSEGRRLFMHPHDAACHRCSAHWTSLDRCSTHCVAHTAVLGGFLSFNNRTCSCGV